MPGASRWTMVCPLEEGVAPPDPAGGGSWGPLPAPAAGQRHQRLAVISLASVDDGDGQRWMATAGDTDCVQPAGAVSRTASQASLYNGAAWTVSQASPYDGPVRAVSQASPDRRTVHPASPHSEPVRVVSLASLDSPASPARTVQSGSPHSGTARTVSQASPDRRTVRPAG